VPTVTTRIQTSSVQRDMLAGSFRAMLISIVTPCLNRAGFIAGSLESVRRQDHRQVEHVIVDGGSTDGTLEILHDHPDLRVLSEPDQGIYDALNKGIGLAEGDVIGFLNTDDLYEPNVLGSVARAFDDEPQTDAVVGGATVFSGSSDLIDLPPVPPGQLLARATVGPPVFNAWFFRRALLEEMEGFDLRYRYVADRELLIRMAFRRISHIALERKVYRYRMHPGSITLSGTESGEAPYVFEMRELARSFLASRTLARTERKLFRAWHSQIVMEQVLAAFHGRAYHRAARYALGGIRHDPGLSIALARGFVDGLRRGG